MNLKECTSFDELVPAIADCISKDDTLEPADDPVNLKLGWYIASSDTRVLIPTEVVVKHVETMTEPSRSLLQFSLESEEGRHALADALLESAKMYNEL